MLDASCCFTMLVSLDFKPAQVSIICWSIELKQYKFHALDILSASTGWNLCSFISVDIMHCRVKTKTIARVFVDVEFVTSGSFDQKEISKLNAAKEALHKLSQPMPHQCRDGLSF
ncbi:hypothetical protein Ddye_027590 [Dipteronia dyeriana]|uniref:DRBM domain-containing protein n=1 Tax=Dipteronia dyeriana TaxID=168575 RepID=A0AAD9WRK4_9ROSI|nr:hypothetical protein Ddye_027590 [Dipteronia dyeriana]